MKIGSTYSLTEIKRDKVREIKLTDADKKRMLKREHNYYSMFTIILIWSLITLLGVIIILYNSNYLLDYLIQ